MLSVQKKIKKSLLENLPCICAVRLKWKLTGTIITIFFNGRSTIA